jgi:hypothetical protein
MGRIGRAHHVSGNNVFHPFFVLAMLVWMQTAYSERHVAAD